MKKIKIYRVATNPLIKRLNQIKISIFDPENQTIFHSLGHNLQRSIKNERPT